ncbi:MAG: hypothetical protein GY861_21415 [bacterium]|nr:hypothetical protein [bacterium]
MKYYFRNYVYFNSKNYNFLYNTDSGFFARWGSKLSIDSLYSPYGPEIIDFELSTKCSLGCSYCYKSNLSTGRLASSVVITNVLNSLQYKLSPLVQAAFGVGNTIPNNIRYARWLYNNSGVVTNLTLPAIFSGDLTALEGFHTMAVSYSGDIQRCVDSVLFLNTIPTVKRVNIQVVLSKETLPQLYSLISAWNVYFKSNLNPSLILLFVKKKGRAISYSSVDWNELDNLVSLLCNQGIQIGSDSCGYHRLRRTFDRLGVPYDIVFMDSCEATRFSIYANLRGEFFPCSFAEGEPGWERGIPVSSVRSFLEDVWFSERFCLFREKLLSSGCTCPLFDI